MEFKGPFVTPEGALGQVAATVTLGLNRDVEAPARGTTLADLRPGDRSRIATVPDHLRSGLAREGIRVGVEVTVEARVPLGGPLILSLGRARIAVGRRVARAIETEP